ncbi:MAG: ATP-dependent RNA helicase HrpA [Proteobacteria bacterium]|nr:MAG: ATP-dependent RNA helicase HrpA [Pseudomonadota bacterium]PIE40114.1 MAG: ATP-dependent RNA helicase HrpA [Gammaproteobacteria bacterium]
MSQNSSFSQSELLKNLPLCLTKDVWRLGKRISQLAKEADTGRREQGLGKLLKDIERSSCQVEARRSLILPWEFPDQLPVSGKRELIAQSILNHQVAIVAGETGSGKTTQLPKICMESGLGARGLIGHTQPRRLAARAVAGRIAEECKSSVGELVGYQVRFHDQVSDNSLVKLMTDGILLAEIQTDPYLRKYEAIIIDEAHERSLNIDFLLGYLKTLLPKRKDLKLIITSATIDVDRFSRFFDGAPVISVSGRTYPVDVVYRPLELLDSDEEDVTVQTAIGQVISEIEHNERQRKEAPGDILIFLSGEREIRETAKHLRDCNFKHTEVMPLYARLSAAEQGKIFRSRRGRKIVLATNVAETSITVPGIRYVIDPGKARISRYSYRSKVQRLHVEAISRASANQRKGRCGRVESGVCYRLYSEEDFLGRPEFTDPEIVRTNLASVILQMARLNLGDIKKFPFIEAPDARMINDGYKLLQELGAVTPRNQLTPQGKVLARIPADPRIARMLVEASTNNCLTEVSVICAALTIQDPKEKPHDKQQAAIQAHKQYEHTESDFLSLLNLWNELEIQRQELSNSQFRKYCQKNFISFLRYREWRDIHRQLHLVFRQLELTENDREASYKAVHVSLLAGLLGQVGQKDERFTYKGARNKVFYLFPGSCLHKKQPKWVMSAELVETSKLYARTVARIEPEWIEPVAAHVVKKSHFEPHWEKKRGQVVGYENVSLYGLPIVQKRKMNYAKVDAVLSREIFIRSGLVEGEIQTRAPFYKKNLQLIEKIASLEDKTRRRDILIEDDVLYDLYDRLIPDDIVSTRHFDAWWKKLSKDEQAKLELSADELKKQETDYISRSVFPDFYQTDSVRFKLDYTFDPGESSDGVTLITPVAALKQLSDKKLEWIVPGFLKEKCTQLIKGLPKQYRKHFVPVPDFVDKVLPKLESSSESLTWQLSKQLGYLTGVKIPPEIWQGIEVEPHLRINIKVVDENGKKLMESRDLNAIMDRFGNESVQNQAIEQIEGRWGKEGITGWDFGEIPAEITTKQAGVTIRMYPYLDDCRVNVSLLASTDRLFAETRHRNGLARLIALHLGQTLEHLTRQLPVFDKTALLFAPVGTKADMLDDFLLALVKHHFLTDTLPSNRTEFIDLCDAHRQDLFDAAMEFDQIVFTIVNSYHQCAKKTKGKINLALASPLADLKQQLETLVYPGFLTHTPREWLTEFPRYFAAGLIRIEKMPREMSKEREFLLYFNPVWEKYVELDARYKKHGIASDDLVLFRWMLEEYRVSFFAQQLGTKMTVSEKRLTRQWDKVLQNLL